MQINATKVAKSYNRIIDNLIINGLISEEMVRDVLSQMQENGKVLRTEHVLNALIKKYNVDRHRIYKVIAKLYAFREIELKSKDIEDSQIEFIRKVFYDYSEETRNTLVKKKVLPFRQHASNRNILIFVVANPLDQDIYSFIRQTQNYTQYEIAYAKLEDIDALIERVSYYENEFLKQIEDSLQGIEVFDEETSGIDESALDAEINRSMLTNLIEGALVEAVRRGASDIHFVPKEGNVTEISFRIDGELQSWHTQDKVKPEAVAAVVKDRATNIDRFDRAIAQDGFIQRKIDGNYIRYRVSVIPIVSSEFHRRMESIVIRVLDDRKVITDLTTLGLQKHASENFRRAISQPQGMVILTGPTGSGKSTTLVAALHYVMKSTKNMVTVEEPVEYMIKGARQIRLNPKLDFDQALRAILRHDPDIVMVGEMRDLKSASIGVSLANTGHLTFSTLHTNDTPSAISRLFMLGVETFLIANAINLVMAQRLVRVLCPKCKKRLGKPDLDLTYRLGFSEEELEKTVFYEPVGCDECYGGYKGRMAIVEALLFTKEIRKIIINSKDSVDEEAIRDEAIKNNMMSLRDSGRERIKAGLTTCEEVIAATMEV